MPDGNWKDDYRKRFKQQFESYLKTSRRDSTMKTQDDE
jgi:hypothetical protein